jgi:hypothetical protein
LFGGIWLVFFPHCKTKKPLFGLFNGNFSKAKRKIQTRFSKTSGVHMPFICNFNLLNALKISQAWNC